MDIRRSQKGMTLTELLVASTFALFLTLGVYAFTSFMKNAQQEYSSSVELTNDARRIIEKMVWGDALAGSERHGIAEARSNITFSATQFQFNDVNGVRNTFRVNSGNIEYQRGAGATWKTLLDPNGSAAYDATKYTTSVVFTQPTNIPNSVLLKVVVGKKRYGFSNAKGGWDYGSASTQVFYRNA